MNPLPLPINPSSLTRTPEAGATFEEHEDLKAILLAGSAHLHPWAGHNLPNDDPGWVCQRIAGWLDKT